MKNLLACLTLALTLIPAIAKADLAKCECVQLDENGKWVPVADLHDQSNDAKDPTQKECQKLANFYYGEELLVCYFISREDSSPLASVVNIYPQSTRK